MTNWITVEDSLKGRARAVERERERIVELLKAEIERVSNPMLVDREYLDGLETAIELIKGENATNSTGSTLPKPQVGCGVNGCNCKGKGIE
jgi:hypothetical protein